MKIVATELSFAVMVSGLESLVVNVDRSIGRSVGRSVDRSVGRWVGHTEGT